MLCPSLQDRGTPNSTTFSMGCKAHLQPWAGAGPRWALSTYANTTPKAPFGCSATFQLCQSGVKATDCNLQNLHLNAVLNGALPAPCIQPCARLPVPSQTTTCATCFN